MTTAANSGEETENAKLLISRGGIHTCRSDLGQLLSTAVPSAERTDVGLREATLTLWEI